MKIRFAFLLLFISFLSGAQTGLIAHKSHSGSAKSYVFAEFGNFGARIDDIHDMKISEAQLAIPILKEVKKVNDSIVILTQLYSDRVQYDTIYNHPLFSDPNMTVDSLKKSFFSDVEFKNFDKKENQEQLLTPIPTKQETDKAISKKQQRKAKRNNSWVILLIIGGGTFVGFGWMTTNLRRHKQEALLVKAWFLVV